MRILLAEDDSVLADGLTRSLRQSGYAIDCVKNGQDADTALSTQEFDLLILDLGLPRLSGPGSAAPPARARLAAAGADPHRGRFDRAARQRPRPGADDYMAKPFALSELEARVRALTRRGQGGGSTVIRHGPLATTRSAAAPTSTTRCSTCRRANWACWKSCWRAPAAWSRRNSWSTTCANGARKSRTTPSRCMCTACARRSRPAACASPPCAAWATASKNMPTAPALAEAAGTSQVNK
jgi:CheY-like chemotaxis protein